MRERSSFVCRTLTGRPTSGLSEANLAAVGVRTICRRFLQLWLSELLLRARVPRGTFFISKSGRRSWKITDIRDLISVVSACFARVTDNSISALFLSRITTDEAAHGGYFISSCFLLDQQVYATSELCRSCFSITTTSYNYGGFLLLLVVVILNFTVIIVL